jgi:hypothetical protein
MFVLPKANPDSSGTFGRNREGVDLPPLEQEVKRTAWNVQRTLLLAGLVWLSLGIGAFVTLSAVIASPVNAKLEVRPGIQWIGLALAAIGLSHLVVYLAGKRKEKVDQEKWNEEYRKVNCGRDTGKDREIN